MKMMDLTKKGTELSKAARSILEINARGDPHQPLGAEV